MFTEKQLQDKLYTIQEMYLTDVETNYNDNELFDLSDRDVQTALYVILASMSDSYYIESSKSLVNSLGFSSNPFSINGGVDNFNNDLKQINQIFINSFGDRLKKEALKIINGDKALKDSFKSNKNYIKNYINNYKTTTKDSFQFHKEKWKQQITGIEKYKVWNYTPNENTRHSLMDGQLRPLNDLFSVTNEVSQVTEFGRYPHDPMLSCANSCTCYCYLTYINKEELTQQQIERGYL